MVQTVSDMQVGKKELTKLVSEYCTLLLRPLGLECLSKKTYIREKGDIFIRNLAFKKSVGCVIGPSSSPALSSFSVPPQLALCFPAVGSSNELC